MTVEKTMRLRHLRKVFCGEGLTEEEGQEFDEDMVYIQSYRGPGRKPFVAEVFTEAMLVGGKFVSRLHEDLHVTFLRAQAHSWFDQLWHTQRGRKRAYKWLRQQMHLNRKQCHFKEMNHLQLKKAIRICKSEVLWGELYFR